MGNIAIPDGTIRNTNLGTVSWAGRAHLVAIRTLRENAGDRGRKSS
jgi:hypothetical protein